MNKTVETIKPGSFEADKHFYPKVVNAQIHPLISYFLTMPKTAIVKRYCHLNPQVKKKVLFSILEYKPKSLYWAGADLFYVTTKQGNRKMVLLETNSCPSGQKSMPSLNEHEEQGGYIKLIKESFIPLLKTKRIPKGMLAVLYDKNYMEVSGYAAAMADAFNEKVLLVPCFNNSSENMRFVKGVLQVLVNGSWENVRAALRYVTQKPWNRIPLFTRTFVFNPVISCLSGARNKLVASKAYDLHNSELNGTGLQLVIPETIHDVSKDEVPLWIQRFGGRAVVKIPYCNAGQGVFTITNQHELASFMENEYNYSKFIVQSLIGNFSWSSKDKNGEFYHIGTIPNKKGDIFVADLRMMVTSTEEGLKPIACYARKAREPLPDSLNSTTKSWDILGTNLSVKKGEMEWDLETNRLLIMDRKDFNTLGIGLDDLIEAFIQTVLAVISIDRMAQRLHTKNNIFKRKLFKSLNNDEQLLNEILLEQT